MQSVIFDIDGTLANVDHRRHYVETNPQNWAAFNANMDKDIPNTPIVQLYKTLWKSEDYELILVTGRSERFRKLTENWLFWHDIPFLELYMRQDHDNRPDHVIKKEILDHLILNGKNILFTVDDRQQVVDMWRENAIPCLQCAKGDF